MIAFNDCFQQTKNKINYLHACLQVMYANSKSTIMILTRKKNNKLKKKFEPITRDKQSENVSLSSPFSIIE